MLKQLLLLISPSSRGCFLCKLYVMPICDQPSEVVFCALGLGLQNLLPLLLQQYMVIGRLKPESEHGIQGYNNMLFNCKAIFFLLLYNSLPLSTTVVIIQGRNKEAFILFLNPFNYRFTKSYFSCFGLLTYEIGKRFQNNLSILSRWYLELRS